MKITAPEIIALVLTLLSLVAYKLNLHVKIIAYYARKGQKWAIDAARNLQQQNTIKEIRRKEKRLRLAIEQADMLSEANNGRIYYVMETKQGNFRIYSRRQYYWFLKQHGLKGTDTILYRDCVYYTKNKIR